MKVLVVGMNPGKTKTFTKIPKNSTFDKLNRWMDDAGVKHYSFMNTFDDIADVPKMSMVDWDRLKHINNEYTVLALGAFASSVLHKVNIAHHKLPHPSPRNRAFNDKNYEKTVVKQLKNYIRKMT